MLFSMFIVLYLFLGGCAAGLVLVCASRSLGFHATADVLPVDMRAFDRCTGAGYALALIVTLASITCLVFDLGSPGKALILFIHPTLTAISFGAYVLAAAVLLLVALCVMFLLAKGEKPVFATARRALEIALIPVAVCLMGYTGVFLALVRTVPLWHTPLTVVLFLLSATSAGYALASLVRSLSGCPKLPDDSGTTAHARHAAVIGAEILALIVFCVRTALRSEVAVRRSVELILGGPLAGWFCGGVVLLGLLVPLVVELALAFSARHPGSPLATGARFSIPADAACLLGCFLLRYCLIAAGMH